MHISNRLLKARVTEELRERQIKAEERPAFHLSPRTGWMNDPNGFSFYKGKYHLFYQYNPYDTNWGPMHWGHAVSEDLIRWEYLPCALAPYSFLDKEGGCFSGGAVELDDGRHLLMYTGTRRERQPDGTTCDVQTQCLAIGDGIDYEKYEKNPVISELDLPEGGSRIDFRDPKIWKCDDGSFRCIIANRAADKTGQLLLYRSRDAFEWEYESTLLKNHGEYGIMWECPDLFSLDGSDVILMSPQDMQPTDDGFAPGNDGLCMIGECDGQGHFRKKSVSPIDYGLDFYATQSILSPDGRRIMLGWMQDWDGVPYRKENMAWFGQVTLPRELRVKNGRLIQTPIREIERYRGKKCEINEPKDSGDKPLVLDQLSGRTSDITVVIRPEDTCTKAELRFAEGGGHYASVTLRPKERSITLDRSHTGVRRNVSHTITTGYTTEDGSVTIRLILDRYSAEIFLGDGEKVMSMTYYSAEDEDGVSVRAEGSASVTVEGYRLELC